MTLAPRTSPRMLGYSGHAAGDAREVLLALVWGASLLGIAALWWHNAS